MRGMNTYVHKSRETSRHSGQRHNVPEIYIDNIATLRSNVATFQNVEVSTSRRS